MAKRITALILYTGYFVCSYKSIQGYTQNYVTPIEFALPFEKDIPFIPISFYVYILAFPFPALLLFVCQVSEIKKIVTTFIGVSLIHYAVFLALPISYIFRPTLSANEPDVTLNLIHQFHFIDSTLNSFPSIHVSFVMITYYFLRQMKSPWTKMGYIMAYTIRSQRFWLNSIIFWMYWGDYLSLFWWINLSSKPERLTHEESAPGEFIMLRQNFSFELFF